MKKIYKSKRFWFLLAILISASVYCSEQVNKKVGAEKPQKETYLSLRQQYSVKIDLKEVFLASPTIYSLLLSMSVASLCVWFYSIFTFRQRELIPKHLINNLRMFLAKKEYEKALNYCDSQSNLVSSMIAAGISARHHGPQFMIDTMMAEGKRSTVHFWQRLSFLNDIVIISPMLGLLGTVIGFFYAFYDLNRSIDSVSSLFDGLGIAVGTTVMGLIVAIMALIFHTTLKHRVTHLLNLAENEAVLLGHLIETKEPAKD
ncbi:MAG: MotA/TolQ/ExbB proton channel family protein [Chlamydiae bacterium]|nr:MotA/TolQ/ExbB proton channel family protein [Chlamydiota bacterium]